MIAWLHLPQQTKNVRYRNLANDLFHESEYCFTGDSMSFEEVSNHIHFNSLTILIARMASISILFFHPIPFMLRNSVTNARHYNVGHLRVNCRGMQLLAMNIVHTSDCSAHAHQSNFVMVNSNSNYSRTHGT